MQPLLSFMDAVLRGIGQVMFQNNRYAGLLFSAGVGVQSWHCAVAMVLGTVVSTGAACVLGVERSALRDGLYGFNGALVGVAAAVFFQPTGGMWAVLVAGAIASTVVMSALSALLARWSIAALTAPFVFTMWVLLSAAPQFVGLASDGQVSLPSAVASAGDSDAKHLVGRYRSRNRAGLPARKLADRCSHWRRLAGFLATSVPRCHFRRRVGAGGCVGFGRGRGRFAGWTLQFQ